jgi:hypothetical protein
MKGYRVLFVIAIAIGGVLSLRGDTQKPREKPRVVDSAYLPQLVFFAVLEGLYEDGVSTGDVNRILAVDPRTQQPQFHEHFVDACPLCVPAFDAFALYRSRPQFYCRKDSADTFGPGLDPLVAKKLHSEMKADQLEAIQTLVNRWVIRRLEMMRLTKDEREQWTAVIEEGRKRGMDRLQQAQAANQNEYFGWKGCAICDGTAAACHMAR